MEPLILGYGATVVVAITLVVLLVQALWNRSSSKYPPGPTSWPLVGNLFSISGGDGFYAGILGLKQKHGDIFRLSLGEMSMIVVFGMKNIHEVLVEKGHIFKYRPNWLYIPDQVVQRKGLFWNNGEEWEKLSKLLVDTQNDRDRQKHLEQETLKEIECTAAEIKEAQGAAMDVEEFMTRSVFNITSTSALGRRYEHDNEEFRTLRENIMLILTNSKSASPANMFPVLAKFSKSKFDLAREAQGKVFDILRQKLKEHQENLDPNKPKDYLDMYLTLSEEEKKHSAFSEENYFRSVIDLFLGGADTTTSMLLWQYVYMVKYPDVQEKCQEEMDRNVGRGKMVTIDDRANLPYMDAAVKELRRVAGSIVITALRTNTEATTIGEYDIPKNSIVICDLRQPHVNAEFWENPDEFRPDRFLVPPEQNKDKPYHPFGLGPRQCVATTIAEDLLFLYLANMLHKFHLRDGATLKSVTLDAVYTGVSNRPKPSDISFIPRD